MTPEEFNPYRAPEAELTDQEEFLDAEALRPVPFEDVEAEPAFWKRVWAMFTLLFQNPYQLVDRVPVTDRLTSPWLFMIVLGIPGYLFGVVIAAFFILMGMFADFRHEAGAAWGWLLGLIPLGILVLVPLAQFLGMILGGLLNHACLWMWGGLKQGGRDLNASLRITGYFLAFFALVSWIPLIQYVALLGGPVPLGMALARVHRTQTWRGICAAYTPILLCCCIYVIFFAIAMTAAVVGSSMAK